MKPSSVVLSWRVNHVALEFAGPGDSFSVDAKLGLVTFSVSHSRAGALPTGPSKALFQAKPVSTIGEGEGEWITRLFARQERIEL